ATSDKPRSSPDVPSDLVAVIRASGVLPERQLAEIRSKVLSGDYPHDALALADRLIHDRILTEYQARKFLANKPQGLVVGRYVIVDRLGSGSMGRVYKAHHGMMDRFVALKIIAPEIVSNERVVSRFQREMRLVGRLDHPNVIRAYDADQIGRVLYIVMEYVQGESFGHYLRRGPIPPREMADYAAQAALGLAHAHDQGIVHRDIKPSNLLLTTEKQVKVLDLGLGVLMEADDSTSFATADGIAVGTVDYMSPEQACGRELDGRSDLYSLGCSVYHLVTSKLPFPGESPIERMGKRINGRPVPITEVMPGLPANFVRVLDKLLAHKPQDRFQSAHEAAEALRAVVVPKVRAKPRPEEQPAKARPVEATEGAVERSALPVGADNAAATTVSPATQTGRAYQLARLVEQRPGLTLLALLGSWLAVGGLGALAGYLLSR
ncbi:MAG: serine/threonine-protein kinase, partial [Isosphaeraceae bacterium]